MRTVMMMNGIRMIKMMKRIKRIRMMRMWIRVFTKLNLRRKMNM